MEIDMEAGAPSTKRRKSVSPGVGDEDGGGVDRFSNLPDAIIGDIISLLPTKEGARTGILSSRWRHLWRSSPLHLDCSDLANHGELAGLVSDILSFHLAPARRFCVPTLRRHLSDQDTTVDAWLRSPALDNLQELDLWYTGALSASTFRFSNTLSVLTIRACDLSNGTVQALHFPLLKQLGIEIVTISECSLHKMIASCPVLECLFIRHVEGIRSIRVNSSSLKRIAICSCGMYRPQSSDQIHVKELIIESAPCLEMLLYIFNYGLHVSVASAPKLETIGFLSEHLSGGVDLSTRLVFGSTVIQGLHVDSLAMAVCTVKFLATRIGALNLDMVIELMRCFPHLEKLYLECWTTGEKNLWRRKHRKLIGCLDIRLKTIVISSYHGFWSEVNFATFFVLNAKVLELMIFEVSFTSEDFIAKQKKKLQLDNRASRGAQFHFTTDRSLLGYGGLDIDHVRDLDLADPFICRY